jgi:hypothetical protein
MATLRKTLGSDVRECSPTTESILGQHFTDETCDNLKHQSIGRPAAGCKTANRLWIEQINTNGGLLKWFKWSATDLSKVEQIEIKLTTN